jgi:hypothetical protein
MLSIQKCLTDKTRLGYVPPSTSDTPSTSKIVFVKPAIHESPPSCVDKGKIVMKGEVLDIPQPLAKPPIRRKSITCHHCGELGHIRPRCPYWQGQRKLYRQAPKTPMCHQCGVSSHVWPRGPPPLKKLPRHYGPLSEILFQGISSSRGLLQQRRLGSPRNLMWRDRRLQIRKPSMKEHPLSALSCETGQISGVAVKKGRT